MLQYGITDGVVVWRAWVLCKDVSKKLLYGVVTLLGLTYGEYIPP